MRSTLLATMAVVGLFAAPHAALAAAPDQGFVQVSLGFGSTDQEFNTNDNLLDDPFNYGARTQWLFPLSQPVLVQTDLFFEQADDVFLGKAWNGSTDSTLFGGAVHFIHPMQRGRIGVAGSLFSVDSHAPNFNNSSFEEQAHYGLVAFEGQYNFDTVTLFGQGGWFGEVACDGSEGCVQNGVFFRFNAAYFLNRNAAVSFDGKLFWAEDEWLGELSGGTAALEGEWRFTDSRFSGFVNVNYEREDMDVFFGTAGQDTVTVSIGGRMYLDVASLMDFIQNGPSMNTPNFHHALATEGTLQTEATLDGVP